MQPGLERLGFADALIGMAVARPSGDIAQERMNARERASSLLPAHGPLRAD